MPEKGLTAIFIFNTGKTQYRFNISGWKIYLVRVLMALIVLLLSSAVIIVVYGLINAGETTILRREILQLQDSLATRMNIEARLENFEYDIQQLCEYRQRLEIIATRIPVPEDSLDQ
ncbi:MAG: hypothetical protein KAT09_03965 [Candidatus Aegiribacteria sp.]|nr:hypothetical protein [Candidatus Aegiribacteria sp.]